MPSNNSPGKSDEQRTSGCLKSTPAKPPEQGLKCPRCDSQNTKFCYYNNYSLAQPRYFCKGCKRYWTKGGALRTIPLGGGFRRRKIIKSSNSKLMMLSNEHSPSGLELFQGFNMDFQLGTPNTTSTSVISKSSMNQELNFTLSSIESVSSINQDHYWKLQQKKLAMLFGGQNNNNTQKEDTNNFISYLPLQNNYQNNRDEVGNYYTTRKEGDNGNLVTEWLLDSSYATVDPVAVDNCSNNRGIIESSSSWTNGMEGWTDFHQYGLIMPL